MNNFIIVVVLGMATTLLNEVSLSLGLTEHWISADWTLSVVDEGGFLDGLLSMFAWGLNNLGAFLQLVTFTTDMPNIVNALLIAPFGLGVFYLIYVMVRGGAG